MNRPIRKTALECLNCSCVFKSLSFSSSLLLSTTRPFSYSNKRKLQNIRKLIAFFVYHMASIPKYPGALNPSPHIGDWADKGAGRVQKILPPERKYLYKCCRSQHLAPLLLLLQMYVERYQEELQLCSH